MRKRYILWNMYTGCSLLCLHCCGLMRWKCYRVKPHDCPSADIKCFDSVYWFISHKHRSTSSLYPIIRNTFCFWFCWGNIISFRWIKVFRKWYSVDFLPSGNYCSSACEVFFANMGRIGLIPGAFWTNMDYIRSPAWMRNHMPSMGWNYQSMTNFNGFTVDIWAWISNLIMHFMMDISTYPCWEPITANRVRMRGMRRIYMKIWKHGFR